MGDATAGGKRRKLTINGAPELGSRRNFIEGCQDALPEAAEKLSGIAIGLEVNNRLNVVGQLAKFVGQCCGRT